MLSLSPAMVVAAASALLREQMLTPASDTDPFDRDGDDPSECVTTAAFVGLAGYWPHYRSKGVSEWPFRIDADCNELARVAGNERVLSMSKPRFGSIYLRGCGTDERFTRAGIVLDWHERESPYDDTWHFDCDVIEGAAQITRVRPDTRWYRDGCETKVLWARRATIQCYPALGDRFIAWVDLDRGRRIARAA